MFTGIINHLGRFEKLSKEGFIFEAPLNLVKKLTISSSIAINGVCLTVKKKKGKKIFVDIMPETQQKTTLGNLQPNSLLNLEPSVTTETFFSGHLVQGHVDGKARLESIVKKDHSYLLKFSVSPKLCKYIVKKGSIAINGIALTVIETGKKFFTVGIIPFTWKNTMIHTLRAGDFVNLEVDMLAKYIEKLLRK